MGKPGRSSFRGVDLALKPTSHGKGRSGWQRANDEVSNQQQEMSISTSQGMEKARALNVLEGTLESSV